MARKKAEPISMEEPNLYEENDETGLTGADEGDGEAMPGEWGADAYEVPSQEEQGLESENGENTDYPESEFGGDETYGFEDAAGESEAALREDEPAWANEGEPEQDDTPAGSGDSLPLDAANQDEQAEPDYDGLLNDVRGMDLNGTEGETPLTLPDDNDLSTESEDNPELPESEESSENPTREETARERRIPERRAAAPRPERILTIDAHDEIESEAEKEATLWHDIQNSYRTRRILTGTLDSVERTAAGMTVAVVNYKGFRIAIPLKEMMIYSGRMPTGREFEELMVQLNRNLNARIGSEIDFVIKGIENKSRTVVASRRTAMLRKRQHFYISVDELGNRMIYEGRVVQARVVAVSEKVVRAEVFGVECAIRAPQMSWEWIEDARERYFVGERILVRVIKISGESAEELSIKVDTRSITNTTRMETLNRCVVGSRYAGKVTDVRRGVVFLLLNNRANAIAHTCHDPRKPGKRDDVVFAVTKLDKEQGVAIGEIIRIIRQNL